MNNGAACCANSLFTQIVAVCSYFPPSKHQDERESKKTGEQESAEWTRSRLVRWSRRREQNELDPLGGRFGSLLLQRPSASSTTAAFPDKAKLFHPEKYFSPHSPQWNRKPSLAGRSFSITGRSSQASLQKKTWPVRQTASAATQRSASALV